MHWEASRPRGSRALALETQIVRMRSGASHMITLTRFALTSARQPLAETAGTELLGVLYFRAGSVDMVSG